MMHIDPKKRLSLYSPHFDEMRRDLDAYITRMFHIMEAKDTKAGTIALKIDFAVLEEQVKCENSPTGEREALIPHIGYKIAMTIRAKCLDCSGNSRREVERCLLKECPLYPYRSVDALGAVKGKKLPTYGQIDIFDL